MMTPLRIKTIEWANFLSYGNYKSTLELNGLGPVLIVGQKDGRNEESNGVGKTTITTAIIWCLFGRTPRKAAPGDKVINWKTKSECYVKITTVDDWVITRTRKVNGHDDLLVHKDGEDITLSTNKSAQLLLKKLFNLDYDIFISSMFFGQRTESFLDMSDMKRKAALERLLGLNRLNTWGDVAKERRITAELEQQKIRALVESKQWAIESLKTQIKNTIEQTDKFEQDKIIKIDSLISEINDIKSIVFDEDGFNSIKEQLKIFNDNKKVLSDVAHKLLQAESVRTQLNSENEQYKQLIAQYEARLASMGNIDIDAIKAAHEHADNIAQIKNELQEEINRLTLDKRKLTQDLNQYLESIKGWNNKANTSCPSCQQLVPKGHTDSICKPFIDKSESIKLEISNITSKLVTITAKFNSLKVERPSITINSALRDKQEINNINTKISELKSKIDIKENQSNKLYELIKVYIKRKSELVLLSDSNIEDQYNLKIQEYNEFNNRKVLLKQLETRLLEEQSRSNPYVSMHNKQLIDLDNIENELSTHMAKIAMLDNHIKQYDYIRHSYHDRNKIKMFILSGLIPYLNQRIEYYLNAFECNLVLKFTSTLSVETAKWDYDFHSGGQQKRIDLAIMFAMYDLYISMYGQQCNVMVLDEVDGALDPHGVRMFVDIINNDFSGDRPDKPDTILIISHKNDMVDQFPSQILISQDADEYSHILKT